MKLYYPSKTCTIMSMLIFYSPLVVVEGIRPDFFKFYGELLRSLSKSVDLVDLSRTSSL